jgi:iron complex transport system substrate-binding protein
VGVDLFGRKLAMVPKGKDIPSEVKENFAANMIVRVPLERVIVASGSYDAGIILELGFGVTFVGSTEAPEEWYHPGVKELYEKGTLSFVGQWNALDFELIKTLDPDLILVSSLEATEALTALGFPVAGTYDPDINTIENRLKLIDFISAFYGAREKGRESIERIKATIEEVKARQANSPKVPVSWGIYYNRRVYALKGSFWMAQLITLAGGDYIFDYLETDTMELSLEEFLTASKDADIFFANPIYEEHVQTKEDMLFYHSDLAILKAFSPEGIVVVPRAIVFQDTGNLDEIALDVGAVIHPELYPDREISYFYYLE